jgi:N-acetyl-D-muramate 6-phosphate phosphatase
MPTFPPPRAILFDLDGTLADTAPDLAAALNHMQQLRQLPLTPFETLRPVASAGARGLLGAGFGIGPDHADYEAMRQEFLTQYESSLARHSRLFDDIPAVLQQLEQRGLRWGVVTNKIARFTLPLIPQIGLQHAACIISGDSTPYSKPHPAPLLAAAQALNLPPQACWYVGDDLRDIQAGQAAGMLSLAAAWGYCGASEPNTWSAQGVLANPMALLDWLV